MAGHSKFKNIMHRKGRADAARSKLFSKLSRDITVAAKSGLPDPAMNPRLRLAVDKALTANMSREVIDRAIARGAGSNEADNMTELSYEGYAPSGVAIIIEAMTDNRNRTAAEVRHAFSKNGGNLGTDGSVAYMFDRKGQISYAPGVDEDALMEAALEAGADDVVTQEDGSVEVYTSFADFLSVNEALTEAGFKGDEAEVAMIPSIMAPITDVETAQKVLRLIDALEDLDDVQNVYHNAEIADEIMQQLS